VPIRGSTWLAGRAMRSKLWVVGYVVGVFVVIPLVGWTLYRGVAA